MTLPPFAAPKNFKSAAGTLTSIHGNNCYWFIFSKNRLLLTKDLQIVAGQAPCALSHHLYMGTWNDHDLFVGEVTDETALEIENNSFEKWLWSPLTTLYQTLNPTEYSLAGRALQLIQWNRSHAFCGACAAATLSRQDEHCRECTACGQLAYPKHSVAILALVKREQEILLVRNLNCPEPFYSLLAGFVEPGETLEQCVEREVFEEVGMRVNNIHYLGSQPWPLSNCLMVGFQCTWQEGEIQMDTHELTHAAWFTPPNLPQLPPLFSLARILIDDLSNKSSLYCLKS